MIRVRQAVVVEGKYDKIRLENVLDATILTTDGFRIFKDREKLALIRAFAARTGVVVLTDSDAAGMVIRRYLRQCIPASQITNLYLPQLAGKEPRKPHKSAEGLLGVEGIPEPVIRAAFERAGLNEDCEAASNGFTKTDFYRFGLSGAPGSRQLREALLARLGLPVHLSANGLLEAANRLFEKREFLTALEEVQGSGGAFRAEDKTALPDRSAKKTDR